MSEAKHTPGPWGYSVAPCGYIYSITQGSNDFIRVHTHNEYNVNLIAAAPDLLEALEVCVTQIIALCSRDDVPDQAFAAIAKAKGQTP